MKDGALTTISTRTAPAPRGHYSQAVLGGGLVFVSGQLPFSVDGTPLEGVSIEEQTRACLANLKAIVEAAGSAVDKIVRVTIYVADVGLWPAVNETYAEFFGDHKPARTVVPSAKLHYGFDLEVDAIAVL